MINNATRPTNNQHNVKKADLYIYDMPIKERRELCGILERQSVWEELAEQMGYNRNAIEVMK